MESFRHLRVAAALGVFSLALLACTKTPDHPLEQKLSNATIKATTTAKAAPSLEGTYIPSSSQIVDSSSAVWTVKDGVVYRNGALAGNSAHVVNLLYFGGGIYQENSSYDWYVWNGSSWAARNELGDPRVESINGTKMPHSTEIIDASHNVWYLENENTLYRNGVKDPSSAVNSLLLYKDVIYQENTNYTWQVFSGGGWKARGSAGDPRVTSSSGESLPAQSELIDSAHDVWTLSNGVIYENGIAATSYNASGLLYESGTIYQQSGNSLWSWNGSAWVGANSQEFALPTAVKNAGYSNRIFFDDFNSLSTVDMKNSRGAGFNWYLYDYSGNSLTPASKVTLVNYKGISAVRLDPSGAGLNGATKTTTGEVVGPSFAVRKDGGAFFEANIAMGETGARVKGHGWPAFWASSTLHLTNESIPWDSAYSKILHYLEFDFMEYFSGNTSNNFNSTVIDWYGEWGVANALCDSTSLCKKQDTQNLGPGKVGGVTSTESAPVFHKFGALWIPSEPNSKGVYSDGSVTWFFDNQPIGHTENWQGRPPTVPTAPAAPWAYSVLDTQTLSLVLGTDSDAFMYVDYVSVWQLP